MKPAMSIDEVKAALYKAAVEGKHEDYEALRRTAAADGIGSQVSPCGNTVLHVAALYGQKQLVEKILETEEDHVASSMLLARNNKNQTALHCAAERGYAEVVSVILSATKKYEDQELGVRAWDMIRMTDNAKDTALHKAVRKGHLDVVKLLVEEDTEFEYLANEDGETPIYLAAESGFRDCLVEILNKCQKPIYSGPLGRNALHAAILSGISDISSPRSLWRVTLFACWFVLKRYPDTTGCIRCLLARVISLCENIDDFGWTPLHYAVQLCDHETVRMILNEKPSAAYIYAGKGDEWTTIFHIAARAGDVKMMECISNSCPNCWEMTNSKFQNVFHEAARSNREEVIKYILKSPHVNSLIDEKDEEGNSPLHLLAISNCRTLLRTIKRKHSVFNKKQQTPLDMALEHNFFVDDAFQQGEEVIRSDSRIGRRGNFAEDPKKRRNTEEEEKHIKKMVTSSETTAIVATLILGLTFAAGFTVPGGYDGNPGSKQGVPVLLRNAAFKAFVITDTIAFICSCFLISCHISMVRASSTGRAYLAMRMLHNLEMKIIPYVYYGVIAAFLCGMYATLAHLRSLAIAVLALTFNFLFIVPIISMLASSGGED